MELPEHTINFTRSYFYIPLLYVKEHEVFQVRVTKYKTSELCFTFRWEDFCVLRYNFSIQRCTTKNYIKMITCEIFSAKYTIIYIRHFTWVNHFWMHSYTCRLADMFEWPYIKVCSNVHPLCNTHLAGSWLIWSGWVSLLTVYCTSAWC